MVNLSRASGCRVSRYLERAFYFETYLPEYAAMYDKLPISAFLAEPETPDPDLDLPNLQFWNCMDYGVVSIDKKFIGSMDFECYTRDFGVQKGTYVCTIDNYHHDLIMLIGQLVRTLQNISHII